jgi:hypothetical protein
MAHEQAAMGAREGSQVLAPVGALGHSLEPAQYAVEERVDERILRLAPLVVLLSGAIADADPTLLSLTTTIGVLAAAVQFLGLVRWPFLVPYIARVGAEPDASPARREAVDVVFQAFNRYLGVAVGEYLGYMLTGAWTTLAGAALVQSDAVPGWIGVIGILVGPVLMLCAFEFVGSHERDGWKVAARLTPIANVAWSVWLAATGIALLA